MSATDGPGGPEDVPTRLIEACERLCSSKPPSSVTVRDVASQAGVTTGLVHHYFESKDALLVSTVRRMAAEIDRDATQALESSGDVGEMVRAVWRYCQARPAFAIIVAWWSLDGRNVTELMGDHPFLRSLVAALGGPARPGAITRSGVIAAMILGRGLLPGMNRALARDPGDQGLGAGMEEVLVATARAPLSEV